MRASPGEPADLEGNRVPCAYCDRVASVRIKAPEGNRSGFRTVAEVQEDLKAGRDPGEPRCLRHLNGAGELSESAKREAAGNAALREKTA